MREMGRNRGDVCNYSKAVEKSRPLEREDDAREKRKRKEDNKENTIHAETVCRPFSFPSEPRLIFFGSEIWVQRRIHQNQV